MYHDLVHFDLHDIINHEIIIVIRKNFETSRAF